MYLFVYGSLKKGFFNHERFGFQNLPFIGKYEINGSELWDLGDYPGMTGILLGNKNQNPVKGEVYDIAKSGTNWDLLRMMEEGAGFCLLPTPLEIGGKQVYSFCYEAGLGNATIIPSGEWNG